MLTICSIPSKEERQSEGVGHSSEGNFGSLALAVTSRIQNPCPEVDHAASEENRASREFKRTGRFSKYAARYAAEDSSAEEFRCENLSQSSSTSPAWTSPALGNGRSRKTSVPTALECSPSDAGSAAKPRCLRDRKSVV